MDSLNLSERQNTPLNFRSTASNTTPFRCPCGGFNEYAQAFLPQAYCFLPSTPGQSQCKHSQETEEKFPMQQHFYPSFPFVSPFFYGNPLTNLYCPHNPGPETPEKQKSAGVPGNAFHQEGKCCRMNNNGTAEEESGRNNLALGPEAQFFGNPYCFPCTANPGSRLQRCGCGDTRPWTCSSFIVPMISYCVIWNSRKSIPNSPEECKQNTTTGNRSDTSVHDLPPGNQANYFNNSSMGHDDHLDGVDGARKTEWGNQERAEDIDQDTAKSFKSLTSSFGKESGFDNTEDNSEKTERNLEIRSDDSEDDHEEDEDGEEDGETDDWADEEKTEQEETPDVYFSNECQTHIKEIESQPPSAPRSYTDLKTSEKNKAPAAGVSCTDMKVDPLDSMAEGEKVLRSRMRNPNGQEKFKRQKTHTGKAVCIKKFINNFTMTDQTTRIHEEAQTSAAAAGDLGGVNCVGYKINVSNCFQDQEFEIMEGTEAVENEKTKEIYAKDLSHSEEVNDSLKSAEKTPKNVRQFRSGIAKLLTSPKSKDTKADLVKNGKTETKEQFQRGPAVGKRKHSCFPTDTTVGTPENVSVGLKTKNHRLSPGTEKQNVRSANNRETLRKEEKYSKVKVIRDAVKK